MRWEFEVSSLVPSGLAVESVLDAADQLSIIVGARTHSAACPTCGVEATRVHSRYIRQARDLPCSGKYVRLLVCVRHDHPLPRKS
jgi:transposase